MAPTMTPRKAESPPPVPQNEIVMVKAIVAGHESGHNVFISWRVKRPYELRRSAVHEPEQDMPLHKPLPVLPARRP